MQKHKFEYVEHRAVESCVSPKLSGVRKSYGNTQALASPELYRRAGSLSPMLDEASVQRYRSVVANHTSTPLDRKPVIKSVVGRSLEAVSPQKIPVASDEADAHRVHDLEVMEAVPVAGMVDDCAETASVRRLELVHVDVLKLDHPVRSSNDAGQHKVAFAKTASSGSAALLADWYKEDRAGNITLKQVTNVEQAS